jgi:hypothetical protein
LQHLEPNDGSRNARILRNRRLAKCVETAVPEPRPDPCNNALIRVACRKRVGFNGRSGYRGARHRSILAFVSVATPILRAAGALIWLINPLGNRTRERSSLPRKRRRRRRPRKSRRGRQRSRNRSASKTGTVGNGIPALPRREVVTRVRFTNDFVASVSRASLARERTFPSQVDVPLRGKST